ncbi:MULTISPECIES: C39 family peptidase [Dyella]|uniref:C39 family peptidase n=1 Tax=Dyella TaxID=231454 RepID=UPI000C83AA1B|nr:MULTISPECIES: C39 family peptidase [Dyella]MDR3446317.1 C39 family peptidase [Dyella sp.]PMQ02772.1 Lactococcin-G-processing and transport ATP-binding protein LagD [Dyella sp. AD56]ULU24415.1 C39 family peptidase [Dyella terrae]
MKKLAALLVISVALPLGSHAATVGVVSGDGNYVIHLTSLKEARYKTTLHQKYDFSCGSAAVATLLTYQYGYPMNEQVAFEQMYSHGDREKINKEGFSLLDIKRFLGANGFDADGFRVPLDKLVEEKLPAIVLIDERGYHHFVVIKGVRNDRVLVGDPARGTRVIAQSRFMTMWTSGLVFVIHNRRNQAVFNSVSDWKVAPPSPLDTAIDRNSLFYTVMPKKGPDDL